jgi:hypothetical protein
MEHNMNRIEHNAETGVIEEIELTAKEVKALESERVISEAKFAEENAANQARKAVKAAVLAKLGLTEDEVKALLG